MTLNTDINCPGPKWLSDLPSRFQDLCKAQAFTAPEQAWVLAMALRDNPDAFDIPPFDPEILRDIIRDLAPAETQFGYAGFNGPMPVTGALSPANTPRSIKADGPGASSDRKTELTDTDRAKEPGDDKS